MKLGIAGGLTRTFIASPLTPLFLLAALALGLIALITLPREEEPQISVPMVDIHVTANGLKAEDAVKLVTEPLETIVKSIDGVEHVYSQTEDDGTLVTARFKVGTNSDAAILRVHEKIRANMDRIPVGIPEPLIVGRGIDDVAIVVVTLRPTPEAAARWTANGLTRLARELQVEVSKLPDIGLTYIVGEQPEEFRVEPDPAKLSVYGITLQQLAAKIEGANRSFRIGTVREDTQQRAIVAGQTLQSLPEIGNILLTARDGRPVYVRDVANVVLATSPAENRVTDIRRTASGLERAPVRMQPRVLWQQRRVDVQQPAGESRDERRREDAHVAREHDRPRRVCLDAVRERGVVRGTVREPGGRQRLGDEAELAGTREAGCVGPIAQHRADVEGRAGARRGVDREQVRALARDQYDDREAAARARRAGVRLSRRGRHRRFQCAPRR